MALLKAERGFILDFTAICVLSFSQWLYHYDGWEGLFFCANIIFLKSYIFTVKKFIQFLIVLILKIIK